MTADEHLSTARRLAGPAPEDTSGRAGPVRRLMARLLAPVHDRQRRSTEALADAVAAAAQTAAARQDALQARLDELSADVERLVARTESEAVLVEDLGTDVELLAERLHHDIAVLRADADGGTAGDR